LETWITAFICPRYRTVLGILRSTPKGYSARKQLKLLMSQSISSVWPSKELNRATVKVSDLCLPTDVSRYRTLFETYQFLNMDVLSGLSRKRFEVHRIIQACSTVTSFFLRDAVFLSFAREKMCLGRMLLCTYWGPYDTAAVETPADKQPSSD
jgi:hypothetical protein